MSSADFRRLRMTPPESFARCVHSLRNCPPASPTSTIGPATSYGCWPRQDCLRWGLPVEFGGLAVSETEMLAAYETLAAACLTTTFVLTQRNAACQRIANSDNDEIRAELLPRLCAGESFATVGISHLTTSRQHLAKPAVSAVETQTGFVLNGTVPWVTGRAGRRASRQRRHAGRRPPGPAWPSPLRFAASRSSRRCGFWLSPPRRRRQSCSTKCTCRGALFWPAPWNM